MDESLRDSTSSTHTGPNKGPKKGPKKVPKKVPKIRQWLRVAEQLGHDPRYRVIIAIDPANDWNNRSTLMCLDARSARL